MEDKVVGSDVTISDDNSVADLLAALRCNPLVYVNVDGNRWVRRSDIDPLMKLIRSNEKCGIVVTTHSSSFNLGETELTSTIGQASRFIVWGFRWGLFPPSTESNDPSIPSADEMEKWYSALKHKQRDLAPEGYWEYNDGQ